MMKLNSQNLSFKRRNSDNMVVNSKARLVKDSNSSHPSFSNSNVQNNVSFKGVSSLFYKATSEYQNYDKLLKIASKDIDGAGEKLLKSLQKRSDLDGRIIIHEAKGSIQFLEKTFLKSLVDSIAFPVKELPILLKDFGVNLLGKAKIIKEPSKYLSKTNVDEEVNMLRGIIHKTNSLVGSFLVDNESKTIDDLVKNVKNPDKISDGLFKTANKYLDPHTGNYNTVHERSLNRIVSGLIPAAFLANDAYNLSVLCGDKKDVSSKEKDARFKQEVTRIFTNAYLSLITLGALTKYVNKSPVFSATMTALTVLITETSSRIANGKPIKFISKEEAKEINKKNVNNKNEADSVGEKNNASAPIVGDNSQTPAKAGSAKMSLGEASTPEPKADVKSNNDSKVSADDKKTVISFNTLMKAVGGIVAAGFTFTYLKNSEKVNKVVPIEDTFKKMGKIWKDVIYDKLAKKDFELQKTDFDKVITSLEDAGFKNLANKYIDIVGDAANNSVIKFEKVAEKSSQEASEKASVAGEQVVKYLRVDNKYKPVVDMVVEPFKFVWGAIRLPFKLTKMFVNIPASSIRVQEEKFKDAAKIIASKTALPEEVIEARKVKNITDKQEKLAKKFEKFFGKPEEKKSDSNQKIFATSVEKVLKKVKDMESGKITKEQFNEFVEKSVLSSFNSTSQSKFSNADLGAITKIAASSVTSAFLVADNYNMVMLKSDGENKEEAKQRAKERVVQRISALFYQTMFMKWFNGAFANQYHSSLSGMSTVVAANTVTTEVFTRKSIGMPLGAKSYEELAEIDHKNLTRTDFLGKYFRFMSALTGKKALQKKAPKEQIVVNVENNAVAHIKAFDMLNKDKNNATTDMLAIYGSKI